MPAVATIWRMVRSRLRTDVVISTIVHVVVLGSTLVWFTATPHKLSEEDSIPVDIISDTELSKLTAGIKTAEAQDGRSQEAGYQDRRDRRGAQEGREEAGAAEAATAAQEARSQPRGQDREQARFARQA